MQFLSVIELEMVVVLPYMVMLGLKYTQVMLWNSLTTMLSIVVVLYFMRILAIGISFHHEDALFNTATVLYRVNTGMLLLYL